MSAERRLLLELLPIARAGIARGDLLVEPVSGLAEASISHLTEANLDGIMIYPAPLGGWHCDVVFRNTSAGMPNCWGTPVGSPLATRELALAHAPRLLGCVLVAMAMPKTPMAPVFRLFDANYVLKQDILDWAVKARPDTKGGLDSKEQAETRLREVLRILCLKDPETELEGFDDWPFQKKEALLTVLHIAALTGVFVYPVRKDGLPEAG
jgi:hypothetical protein